MSLQEIARFQVREIDRERTFGVVVLQELVRTPTHDNPNATLLGLKQYRTTEGWAVNRLSDMEYEIVNCPGGPVRARRVDPG